MLEASGYCSSWQGVTIDGFVCFQPLVKSSTVGVGSGVGSVVLPVSVFAGALVLF